MLKRKIFFIVLVLFSSSSAKAQDWKADLEKACAVFSAPNLELEVEHLFYSSTDATVPFQRNPVWMQKMGTNYHLKQYGIEVISNSKYTAFVNEKAKIVGIGKKEVKPTKSLDDEQEKMLKSMVDVFDQYLDTLTVDSTLSKEPYTVKYLGLSAGVKKYQFNYKYGKFQQSTVFLSNKTGLLEKISCILRQPLEVEPDVFRQVRVEIVYKRQEVSKKYTESMFSTDALVKVSENGDAVLADKFSQYQLLNNITR